MTVDLKAKVGLCETCLAKRQKHDVNAATHQPSKNGFVGETLYVDLVGPLPQTAEGSRYILTCEDGFSRFVLAYPIENKEAVTVAKVLLEKYLVTFGFPTRIHSDNGQAWWRQCQTLVLQDSYPNRYFDLMFFKILFYSYFILSLE